MACPRPGSPTPGSPRSRHSWAAGEDLSVILDADDELTPGDFVRDVEQLIDLLRQIAAVTPHAATRSAASAAADAIHRGVVALSGTVDPAGEQA